MTSFDPLSSWLHVPSIATAGLNGAPTPLRLSEATIKRVILLFVPRTQDNKGKGADAEVMALSPAGKFTVETPAALGPRVAQGAQERGERSWTKCLKAWRHQKCLCHPKPKPPGLTGSPLWHPFCLHSTHCGVSASCGPWPAVTSELRTAGLFETSLDPGAIPSKG